MIRRERYSTRRPAGRYRGERIAPTPRRLHRSALVVSLGEMMIEDGMPLPDPSDARRGPLRLGFIRDYPALVGVLARELEIATQLAREAGRLVLEVYGAAFDVDEKPDGQGPVTEADRRANTLLVDGLRRAFPTDDIVAEESPDRSQHRDRERCWFVDPLDGTRELVDRTGMFAIQIGLAIHGVPDLGVVYGPVDDRLFVAVPGETAYSEERGSRRLLTLQPPPVRSDELRLVVSRSHPSPLTDRFRQKLGIHHVQAMGSVGLKCGAIAEGRADLYVHFSGRTHLWDTCAPEAVLRAAGGVLTDLAGVSYRYDGHALENRRGLIGCHPDVLARVLPVAREIARAAGLA